MTNPPFYVNLSALKMARFWSLDSHAMVKVASRRPLKADARVGSQLRPCEVRDGQTGTGTADIRILLFSIVSVIKPWFYNPVTYHLRSTSTFESVVKTHLTSPATSAMSVSE